MDVSAFGVVHKSFTNFSGKAVPISQLSRAGRLKLRGRIKADKMSRAKTGRTVGGNLAAGESKLQHSIWDQRLAVGREAAERSRPSGLKNVSFDSGVSRSVKDSVARTFPKGTKKPVTFTSEIPGGEKSPMGMMAAGAATSTPNTKGFRTIHVNQKQASVMQPDEIDHVVAHEYGHIAPRRGANPGRISSSRRSGREEARADVFGAKTTGRKGRVIPGGYDSMAAKQAGQLPPAGIKQAIGRMVKPNMSEYTKMRQRLGRPVDTSIRADIQRGKSSMRMGVKGIKARIEESKR